MKSNPVEFIDEDNCYLFCCPNCDMPIQVEANHVNCKIFRHGTTKNKYTLNIDGVIKYDITINDIEPKYYCKLQMGGIIRVLDEGESKEAKIVAILPGQQIPAHACEEKCRELSASNLIFGCCKPFKLIISEKRVEQCDYI